LLSRSKCNYNYKSVTTSAICIWERESIAKIIISATKQGRESSTGVVTYEVREILTPIWLLAAVWLGGGIGGGGMA
jgi:hypothetical protein